MITGGLMVLLFLAISGYFYLAGLQIENMIHAEISINKSSPLTDTDLLTEEIEFQLQR